MNYADKVLSRVTHPGFLILVAGAAAAYMSGLLTRRIADAGKREKVNLAVKAAGGVIALAGAVLLFL